jgi:hypothetical protein
MIIIFLNISSIIEVYFSKIKNYLISLLNQFKKFLILLI